jgi:hypothetical protein
LDSSSFWLWKALLRIPFQLFAIASSEPTGSARPQEGPQLRQRGIDKSAVEHSSGSLAPDGASSFASEIRRM